MLRLSFAFLGLLLPLSLFAAPDCSRPAGSLPNPAVTAGTSNSSIPIQHILVIMQENHSFDNYFGSLSEERFYGSAIDGARPDLFNLDAKGNVVHPHRETNLCAEDPAHNWNAVHQDWDHGALDNFVKVNDKKGNGSRVMGYYGAEDLPFYYALANQFTVGDRYFCSALTQTFPNRFYLLTGTSFGNIQNLAVQSKNDHNQKTIFDELDQYHVNWKYYSDGPGYLKFFQPLYLKDHAKIQTIADYEADLTSGRLPQVVFLDTSAEGEDEHPDGDIQYGQAWVAKRVRSLMASSAWKNSVLFLTYDENGGYYDHVAPPDACAPDNVPPMLNEKSEPGAFDHYGFRVPFVAVSPYAKHHFVSHKVFDHTSILKFIETKFNLPALTARDANADAFSDVFDYAHPQFAIGALPEAKVEVARLCSEEVPFVLPSQPAHIQAKGSGFCLAASPTGELLYAVCAPSDQQKFLFSHDTFHNYRIQNLATKMCVTTEDQDTSKLFLSSCTPDEDHGLEIFRSDDKKFFEFTGWSEQACWVTGGLGSVLKASTDCPNDGSMDFQLF